MIKQILGSVGIGKIPPIQFDSSGVKSVSLEDFSSTLNWFSQVYSFLSEKYGNVDFVSSRLTYGVNFSASSSPLFDGERVDESGSKVSISKSLLAL